MLEGCAQEDGQQLGHHLLGFPVVTLWPPPPSRFPLALQHPRTLGIPMGLPSAQCPQQEAPRHRVVEPRSSPCHVLEPPLSDFVSPIGLEAWVQEAGLVSPFGVLEAVGLPNPAAPPAQGCHQLARLCQEALSRPLAFGDMWPGLEGAGCVP